MKYCKKCVYPFATVNLDIADDGICSSCKSFERAEKLSSEFWNKRKKRFEQILEETINNNTSNYDCLIPVSGGKDSSYISYNLKHKKKVSLLAVTISPPLEEEIANKKRSQVGNAYLPVNVTKCVNCVLQKHTLQKEKKCASNRQSQR